MNKRGCTSDNMKSFLNRFGKREEGRGRETLEQGSRVIACADTSTLLAYLSYAGHLTLLFAELIEFYNLISDPEGNS